MVGALQGRMMGAGGRWRARFQVVIQQLLYQE
jgi:hypothetical protein